MPDPATVTPAPVYEVAVAPEAPEQKTSEQAPSPEPKQSSSPPPFEEIQKGGKTTAINDCGW